VSLGRRAGQGSLCILIRGAVVERRHQWLFVKDTTDALYPDNEASRMETITESLSETIAARYQTHVGPASHRNYQKL
jgi:hypothetical protein